MSLGWLPHQTLYASVVLQVSGSNLPIFYHPPSRIMNSSGYGVCHSHDSCLKYAISKPSSHVVDELRSLK